MKQIFVLFMILLIFLILIILRKPAILEHAIEFEPPYLTNSKDKNTIGELMRIGTQANTNSTYDTVDTNLLMKPK
jgi:hypothetical protein